jgi:hypothetical protein
VVDAVPLGGGWRDAEAGTEAEAAAEAAAGAGDAVLGVFELEVDASAATGSCTARRRALPGFMTTGEGYDHDGVTADTMAGGG